VVFHKARHSALVGSGLDVWLTENGIRKLLVSGIRTEQCCETTTRHASDLGYTVDYVSEATLTFAMTNAA
uniref:isochorismatase family protein n=2 Tax=Pseudomonadota TaxID=1224 RepID=UPI0013D5342D